MFKLYLVLQAGNHEDLLSNKGTYYALMHAAALQLLLQGSADVTLQSIWHDRFACTPIQMHAYQVQRKSLACQTCFNFMANGFTPMSAKIAQTSELPTASVHACVQKKEPEHVATVGDMSKGVTAITRLCYHLAELQEGGHIELKAKLAQGPAHPEFIKLAEADACGEAGSNNGRARKPMHAVVDIFLTEKAVVAGGEDPADVGVPIKNRGKGKKSTLLNTWQVHSRHIAPILNWLLLTDPEGLQIGPDSDGLVNFCDQAESSRTTPAAQAEEELRQEAAEGSNALLATADATAGPSKGAESKRSPSEGSSHETVTVQQMLDSVALPDDAATAVAPGALRSIPKQFQLQGLQWMLDRERQGDALGR